ncbi:MAG: outer membrane beta-barrel domain-containing protein [Gammaproteobacteria bacterium]
MRQAIIVLTAAVLTTAGNGCALLPDSRRSGDDPDPEPTAAQQEADYQPLEDAPEQVIQPDVERRDVVVPEIDTENFEVGLFAGYLGIEDFGSEPVYGARFAYHVTEDFFVEAAFGLSSVSDGAFRNFGLSLFPEEEEDVVYYNASLGYNVLPGEFFLGKRRAWTSGVFLIGGVGNTELVDDNEFTFDLGFGIKALPTDYLSVRLDVRDYLFESDLLGDNKLTNNFEFTAGLGLVF